MTSSSGLYSQGFGTTSSSSFPGNAVVHARAPSSADIKGSQGNYSIGQLWVDTSASNSYQLVNITSLQGSVSAVWALLGGGSTTGVITVNNIDPDGSGNFSINAGSNITITPGSNAITIASTDASAIVTIDGDTGSVTGSTVTISGGSTGLSLGSSGTTLSMTGILTVPYGGTGQLSIPAYSVVCGGTTSSGGLQTVSGLGTSGQVLTSAGASALPTWTSLSSNITTNTWVPTLAFGGASTGITYTAHTGSVMQIGTSGSGGALVFATGQIQLSSKGSATGAASLNIPVASTPGTFQCPPIIVGSAITLSTGNTTAVPEVTGSSALLYQLTNTTVAALDDTNFADTSFFTFTLIYRA